jgi:hypothetical protein
MWLASYPRSGNTWTRVFLYNISRVLAGKRGPADLAEVTRFAPWDVGVYPRVHDGGSLAGLARHEIAALRPKLQAAVAAQRRGLTLLKTHSARTLDCGVPIINADVSGGAVYVVRNPLDVAVSYARHMGIGVDRTIKWMERPGWTASATDKQTYEVIGSWSENVSSWTEPSNLRTFVFRYEDALARPHDVFGRLARFVGLAPDNIQLGLAVEYSAFSRLKQQERETGFRERAGGSEAHFRVGEVGGRRLLSDQQVDRIVRAHGQQMSRFGYLP